MSEKEKEAIYYLISNFDNYKEAIFSSNYNIRYSRELIENLKVIKDKLEREWYVE